ncbi:Plasmodium exported protein, unknown function [Plasmodium knowlesi strain H]|uniref:Plasmodium RESA N-terminal domain-containing protein n=3 Tax=Plasmodium knowlesi TaxID=5850 RepID=A0A1A7VVD8_PLAKH|nr:Plasmodium exported protein, unknown function [Plasmodium knowlesi strain H]OTN63598.1 Uncharacterized protein PKNOH_S140218200 [Plasmodium knowlesi]CAA9990610.1 Plasmodium exported protein, unknown function [Plasmodium knowlesi strain H]SBO26060.1 Plasmodium exported protein, unknown function [Plasmodium knowlesi strain H]SBO28749.1 Plasmodium exported protein, unknown function [Plasmodium knowlesi strain H]VVS80084.1 Plasmodium exported protein, unknown function [Plasmodium knowlesi strai
MNSITLLLHVIALTFVFWQFDSLWDMRGPIKRPANRQHISGGKLGSSFGRILHEADEASTETPSNYSVPYVRLVDYSDSNVYYAQLEEADGDANADDILQYEFANNLNKQLSKDIIEMASEYLDFTEMMDTQWRDKMWTDIWVKYLSSIIQDLQKYISYTFLPINSREQMYNNLMHLTRNDFKSFLNTIDEKWNEKLNKNDV